MKKIRFFLLAFAVFSLILGSCVNESVTYCPFCGKSGIKEISEYDTTTGLTVIHYECTNSECGKKFGAGKL